jgi:hypothetical protein
MSEFETRFAHIEAEAYFADPCETPSLSASIAHILHTESPLHAWQRHPRFGGTRRATTKSLDDGSLSHALLLGAGKDVEVIKADDYRTNAAKEKRDAARDAGKVPVLEKDYAAALVKADAIRARMAELDEPVILDGESELTALWTETASNGGTVQCRGMLDHAKLPRIYDIKSIRSANPDVCRRHVADYGYAIQRAAYVRAVERIRPDLAGRVDFVFVFYELEPPYAVTPIRLDGSFREIGERAWRRAVDTWERCLNENRWPTYTTRTLDLEPSPWVLAREAEREFEVQR